VSDINQRAGFAMILAIFVMVLVSLGGVLLLSNTSVGSKSMGDNYLKAQAELLADSATEFAVMRAQGATCLENLNITVKDASGNAAYDINASLSYSFIGAKPASCTATHTLASNTGSNTRVLIDVTVSDHNLNTERIRVHKRSWQKL
jgi:competence protein ComGC